MFKRSIILLTMTAVAALGLYAQADGLERKIVGTWVDQEGSVWRFTASGYVTIQDEDGDETERERYGVAGSRMFFAGRVWEAAISADGKTVIINEVGDSDGFWLTKK
jgi:hypothetical protein